MEVTSCPRAGLGVQAAVPHPPRVWGGDVTDPRGLDPLSHYELGLDVRVDFRLPDGVLEVEAQASSLTGATSAPAAAAAVTAASFTAGGPVVGTPSVPPRLPPQAFLLQQELEAFHFAACGAVLCLSQTVSYKRRPGTCESLAPTADQILEHQSWSARISKGARKPTASVLLYSY